MNLAAAIPTGAGRSACAAAGAASAAARQQQRPCPQQFAARRRVQQQRGPPPAGAASVDLNYDALSSVDIESISYDGAGGIYTVQGCLMSPATPERVYQVCVVVVVVG